jgi:hypothetical protein
MLQPATPPASRCSMVCTMLRARQTTPLAALRRARQQLLTNFMMSPQSLLAGRLFYVPPGQGGPGQTAKLKQSIREHGGEAGRSFEMRFMYPSSHSHSHNSWLRATLRPASWCSARTLPRFSEKQGTQAERVMRACRPPILIGKPRQKLSTTCG